MRIFIGDKFSEVNQLRKKQFPKSAVIMLSLLPTFPSKAETLPCVTKVTLLF